MRLEKEVHDKVKEEIRRRLEGKVDVQLGKRGITEGFVKEVKTRLSKRGVVKVRVLKSYLRASGSDVEEIAREIASRTGGVVRDVRGHTFIIVKKRGADSAAVY
ncbi:YhbY family RNA-binding protein [Thermogladius sp. KZ2Tp1]|uniref:YhbY family RNA-binding protein n=1 Tax=Thermogladius sp. KZ2Tp1 TaxID=3136289 RepID=UPI003DA7C83D